MASSSFSDPPTQTHHRRRSSASSSHAGLRLVDVDASSMHHLSAQPSHLPSIPAIGTPHAGMSLSLSPSPSPYLSNSGLDIDSSRHSGPAVATCNSKNEGASNGSTRHVMWDTVRQSGSNARGKGSYLWFKTQKQGFFTRHMQSLSNGLPLFNSTHASFSNHATVTGAEKKKMKLATGPRWGSIAQRLPVLRRIQGSVARISRGVNIRFMIGILAFVFVVMCYNSSLIYKWRRIGWLGGGNKFVIILAANVGGGVMEWKGAREWAIERDSVRNKKKYAARWGYNLEIVDMSTKKRYAHEWRESWEKVDFVRNSFRKYPHAEWIWWLDLNTFIMEPSYSLQSHIFNDLAKHVYRDINEYNPLNIKHPIDDLFLEAESRSPVGDGQIDSVNLLLSQDCSGFNLGSFFVRRSTWTDRLLDVWWDPVAYEQKHMDWEHKEQDALEQLYTAQPWIRKHTGFLPQRMLNSFPIGACSAKDGQNDKRIHYDEQDRDFVVNMAGCEWGRDCWGEMYHYRELSYYLNRNRWERFKEDFLCRIWFKLTGQKVKF